MVEKVGRKFESGLGIFFTFGRGFDSGCGWSAWSGFDSGCGCPVGLGSSPGAGVRLVWVRIWVGWSG